MVVVVVVVAAAAAVVAAAAGGGGGDGGGETKAARHPTLLLVCHSVNECDNATRIAESVTFSSSVLQSDCSRPQFFSSSSYTRKAPHGPGFRITLT